MINPKGHPVGWGLLLMELDEAFEHLGQLIREMNSDPAYDEARLRVDMGHIAAHINRAWTRRNHPDDLTGEQWEASRGYPSDLEPIA